jgi:mono/diheme cytochrome c family protein
LVANQPRRARGQGERVMPAGSGRGRVRGLLEVLGACLLLGAGISQAEAVEKDLTARGEALVSEHCARCHAIAKGGASPHKDAPPFRILSRKYPVEDLAEALAEGIVAGHPDMPIFVFNAHDVAAILQYLESIQEQASVPAEQGD